MFSGKVVIYSWHGVKNLKEGALIQSERTS